MKKLFSLLLIVGLGCCAIGCSDEPGVSTDIEVSDDGEAEMGKMSDPAAGIEDSPGGPPVTQGDTTEGGDGTE